MAVLQKQMTRCAYAARLMIFPRRFAQQSLRHKPRKRCFAGIFLAGKQPSIRTVFPMAGKLPPLVLMPRINHIGKYKRLNKNVIIQGNVGGRLKLKIQFETFITSSLSSFRLFSAFLILPSSPKAPYPYSPNKSTLTDVNALFGRDVVGIVRRQGSRFQ